MVEPTLETRQIPTSRKHSPTGLDRTVFIDGLRCRTALRFGDTVPFSFPCPHSPAIPGGSMPRPVGSPGSRLHSPENRNPSQTRQGPTAPAGGPSSFLVGIARFTTSRPDFHSPATGRGTGPGCPPSPQNPLRLSKSRDQVPMRPAMQAAELERLAKTPLLPICLLLPGGGGMNLSPTTANGCVAAPVREDRIDRGNERCSSLFPKSRFHRHRSKNSPP